MSKLLWLLWWSLSWPHLKHAIWSAVGWCSSLEIVFVGQWNVLKDVLARGGFVLITVASVEPSQNLTSKRQWLANGETIVVDTVQLSAVVSAFVH